MKVQRLRCSMVALVSLECLSRGVEDPPPTSKSAGRGPSPLPPTTTHFWPGVSLKLSHFKTKMFPFAIYMRLHRCLTQLTPLENP